MKTMTRHIAAVAVALCAGAAFSAESESYKLKFVPRTTGTITVDGTFDEAAWKDAAVIDDWGEVRSSLYGRDGCRFPKTEARLLWDDRYLYIALTCWEDTPENMQSFRTLSQDRSCAIYWRDCVEFHVNGHGEATLPKVQVWLNATDERCAVRYFDDGFGPMTDNDHAQVMDWQKAYSYGDDCWRLEVRMALRDLDCKGGVGARMALNMGRFRLNKKFWSAADGSPVKLGRDMQILAWTARDRSHHDTHYGRLILVDREPKSILEGLKRSYPDLAAREILIQTEGKYIVVKNGTVSEKTYLDQARELASRAKPAFDRFAKLAAEEPAPAKDEKFFARHLEGVVQPRQAMEAAIAKYAAADAAATPGELNDLAKKAEEWEKAFDTAYWMTLRDLVRLEGAVRHPVALRYVEGNPAPLSVLEQCWFRPWERHYTGPVWAKPLAAKRPRVLVHVGQNDTYAAWRLKDRLDIDMDVWYSNNGDGRYRGRLASSGDYGITEAQKIQQLENLLAKNEYDGYVFIGASPYIWPARLQCALAERLVKGAKAVVINGRDWGVPTKRDKSFALGNPAAIDMLDYPKGFAFNTYYELDYRPNVYRFPPVATGPIGKGRYTTFSPGMSFNFLIPNAFTPGFGNAPLDCFQDEYVRAANVRVVMEGLGLRGPATLVEVVHSKVAIGKPFDVTVRGTGAAGAKAALKTVVRDGQGKVVAETTSEVKGEGEQWSECVSLPGLGFGRYGVTATLVDARGGVMDFVSGYVRVTDGGAAIASLEIAKPCFEKGEDVVATAFVSNAAKGLKVVASVRDPELRTLLKDAFPVGADGRAAIRFSDARLTRNCHFVVAELVKDGVVVDRTEREFYRHIGAETDFEVFGDASHGSTEDLRLRQAMLEWAGIDLWQSGSPTRHFWGGSPVIRSCIHGKFNFWGGTIGAKWHAKRLADRYSAHAKALKAKNGRYLSIGDDSSPAYYFAPDVPDWVTPLLDRIGKDHGRKSPRLRTRDAVVKFLKTELRDDELGALKEALAEAYGDDVFWFNAQNGLNLASLDEVTVAKMREANPLVCCEFANFIRFVRERYGRDLKKLNAAWHTDVKDFRDITEKTLDDAKTAGHYRATLDKYDFFEYLSNYEFGAIAKAVHDVYPDLRLGMGASMYMNLLPTCLQHLDSHCPYSSEELDEGRMLKAKNLGHTAGCYFPYTALPNLSTYTIWHSVLSGANFGWFWMSFIAFRGDHAIHPGYIGWTLKAYHDLAEGPAALLIRAKRENDGIRILYSTPSAYITTMRQEDGTHVKSRDIFARMVEELGFQFDFIQPASVVAGELERDNARVLVLPCAKTIDAATAAKIRAFVERGGVLVADVRPATFDENGDDLKSGRFDDLLDLTPGRLDKTGVKAAVRRVGKGLTVYLGCNPIAWKFLVQNGEEAAARRDLLALLAQGGVTPRFRAETADGTPVASVEYTRFTRDGATYLGVEKKPVARERYPLAAAVKLAEPAWVYDVRAGKALGRLSAIPATFEGFDTMLYALLPYEVKGLALEAPASVARGGELKATARIVAPDAAKRTTHLLRFDLVPKGGYTFERTKPIRPQFVDAKDGVGTATFAIAYDEADGYTLEVTDVATGAKAARPVAFEEETK